jgi:PAS domain S-box-containing protein
MPPASLLIIEDEAIIALGIASELEQLGYQVTAIAHHGADALALAQAAPPDLALVDINLRGGMDGIETAVQLRAQFHTPIIFLTGAVDDATVQRAKSADPYGYILKPYTLQHLHITIEHALHKAQLEAAARYHADRYRELFDTTLDGILISDRQGVILDSNPALHTLLRYDAAELRGMNILDLVPAGIDPSQDNRYINEQLQARGYTDEFVKEYQCRDGSCVPISVRIWTRQDAAGETIGLWAILRDLSERQASQKALLESQQRLWNLVDKSPDGIVIVTPTWQVMEWNQALAQITEISAMKAIGQSLWEIQYSLLPPEQQTLEGYTAHKQLLQATLPGTRPAWSEKKVVQEIRTPRGNRKLVEWITYPIREQTGTIFIGVIRDITAERAAAAHIQRQADFSHKLAHFTERLNAEMALPKVLEVVCREVCRSLQVEAAQVTLYDPQQDSLTIAHSLGPISAAELRDTPYPYIFRRRLGRENQPYLIVPDVQAVLQGHPFYDFCVVHDIRTVVTVNLICENRLIGTLDLACFGAPRAFDEQELTFLLTFANHAASGVDRAQIYQQTQRRTAELETLGRLSAFLRQADTPREMLPVILSAAIQLARASDGMIYLLGQGGRATASYPYPLAETTPDWARPDPALWEAALAGDSLVVADLPALVTTETAIQQCVLIPCRSSQVVVAMLILGFDAPHPFAPPASPHDPTPTLLSIAELGANALHRSGLLEMLEQRVHDRTRELTALYDLTLLVNSSLPTAEALQKALDRIVATNAATGGIIYGYEANGHEADGSLHCQASSIPVDQPFEVVADLAIPGWLCTWLESDQGPSLTVNDQPQCTTAYLLTPATFEAVLHIPIRFEATTYGVLIVLWREEYDPTAEGIAFFSTAAERLGSFFQHNRLRQKSEQAAVLEERQRLARELHDSVTQSLYSMTLLTEAGLDLLSQPDLMRLQKCLHSLQTNSVQALKEMRLLLFELRPPADEAQNLAAALENRLEAIERRAGVEAVLEVRGDARLPAAVERELYRVASEALSNSLKHANARRVWVRLQTDLSQVHLEIADDGCGFDPASSPPGGMGLNSMRARMSQLGGSLTLTSTLGQGTQVTLDLSLPTALEASHA